MRCPVCGIKIKNYHIDTDEQGVMEERAKCDEGNHFYSYEFAYGEWNEKIGDIEIEGSYKDSGEEIKIKMKIMNLATNLEKMKLGGVKK